MPVSVRPKWEKQPHKSTYSQCNKSFRQSQHLTRHLITHTGEKSHNCAQCSKSFTDAGTLKRHLLTHSGEKAHNCLQRSKSFNQAGDLKIRLLTHSGVKQFIFLNKNLNFVRLFARLMPVFLQQKKRSRLFMSPTKEVTSLKMDGKYTVGKTIRNLGAWKLGPKF